MFWQINETTDHRKLTVVATIVSPVYLFFWIVLDSYLRRVDEMSAIQREKRKAAIAEKDASELAEGIAAASTK